MGGVGLYPLVARVKDYQGDGFAMRIAFRRLECPFPHTARARLADFALRVEGKVTRTGFPAVGGVGRVSSPGFGRGACRWGCGSRGNLGVAIGGG